MKLVRVNGPPGCGKTTYLASKVNEVASKFGGSAVVVASLTRAAAAEVAGRKTDVPAKNIGTLHSHAYQSMKRPVIAETSEGLAAWNEWVHMPSMRIDPKMAVDPENAPPEQMAYDTEGAAMLNQANILRQQMIDSRFWPPRLQRWWDKWCQWKNETGIVDFTDLIERAIDQQLPLPQKPMVLMIDEAQDMSKLEFTLAMMWGADCEYVMIVGDADQNLYEWRGSDPQAFTSLEAQEVRTLEQSYRVPIEVHRAAVGWIAQIPDREPVTYHPRMSDGDVKRVDTFLWQDPVALVNDCQAQLEREPTHEDHPEQMILASCSYMLNPIITELKDKGVPFWNPYRTKNGYWNPLRGGGRLLSFLAPQDPQQGGEGREWTWKDLHRWIDPLQAKGVLVRGTKTMIESHLVKDRFKDSDADEIVPVAKVMEMFVDTAAQDAVWNGDIDWWEAHLRNDDLKRQQYPLTVVRKQGIGALRTKPRLCVGTIHSVKGGQADRVYLLPDLSAVAYFEGWLRGGRSPIVRQFYVGMTRARQELVLCGPSGQTKIDWPVTS